MEILVVLRIMLEKFAPGHWSFLRPGSEKKWYGTHVHKPNGEWDEVAEITMINFSESGHPVFRGSSAFEREDVKSEGKGRSTMHFNASDETTEVILRAVISVNQLSFYGAVAEMCGELALEVSRNSQGTGKPEARENLDTILMPLEMSTTNQTSQRLMQEYRETCFVNTNRDSQIYLNMPNWPNSAPMLVSRSLLKKRTVLHNAWWWSTWQTERIMSRVHFASKWSIIWSKKMDPWKHKDRSRTLRCWNQDRIPLWWQDLLLGSDREWNQQIRNRSVRRDSRCKCWGLKYKETCCEGQTMTDIKLDVVSCVCSIQWTKKWIDIEPGNSTKVVWRCRNWWSDCYDMTIQYVEKKTEQ